MFIWVSSESHVSGWRQNRCFTSTNLRNQNDLLISSLPLTTKNTLIFIFLLILMKFFSIYKSICNLNFTVNQRESCNIDLFIRSTQGMLIWYSLTALSQLLGGVCKASSSLYCSCNFRMISILFQIISALAPNDVLIATFIV